MTALQEQGSSVVVGSVGFLVTVLAVAFCWEVVGGEDVGVWEV